MIRLESLRTFGLTADPTWDNIPTTFWSTLETATALFCACMPSIRAGLVVVFPKVVGSTNHLIGMGVESFGNRLNTASPSGSDNMPMPSRIVQKPEQQLVSLSPFKFYAEPDNAFTVKTDLSAKINSTSGTAVEHKPKHKEIIVQNGGFITTKTAPYLEYSKPLPLTPTSKSSLSLSISTTTSTDPEDQRDDDEKFGSDGNLPGASQDTSRLV